MLNRLRLPPFVFFYRAPYLALLGDIGLPSPHHPHQLKRYEDFLMANAQKFKKVFVLAGNHVCRPINATSNYTVHANVHTRHTPTLTTIRTHTHTCRRKGLTQVWSFVFSYVLMFMWSFLPFYLK